MRLRFLLAFVFISLFTTASYAQLSTKHFIPPITSDDNDAVADQYIYISTPRTGNVSFTIKPVGNSSNDYSGVVSNANPFVYRVVQNGEDPADPNAVLDTDGNTQFMVPTQTGTTTMNTVLSDRGYIIEASDVIYVSIRFRSGSQFHAGALVSKGLSGLGTVFRAGGFRQENDNIIGGYLTFLSVMATEDDTNVTFSDFTPGISILNHAGSGPINANMNEGDSYILAVSSDVGGNPNDLIGSLITSDKPIVVNSGSTAGSFANSFAAAGRDYGVDQIADASKIGSEYIFVRGNGPTLVDDGIDGDRWENILIVAHEDNTDVFINGSGTPEATLNAGEHTVIEGSFFTSENMYVQTSNPVFAYQGIAGSNNNPNAPAANQGIFFVPPLSCENRGNVDNIAQINRIYPGTDAAGNFDGGISIVTNRGATIEVSQNGANVPITMLNGPFDVDGNFDYVTYKLQGLIGDISVSSTEELYCAYFNQNGAATAGSFYSGFPSPPEISFTTTIATLGNCIPNLTLTAANQDQFDSLEWFFDDGSGFVSVGMVDIANPNFEPTLAGNYQLVGTLNCSGATFESAIIPVSLCPFLTESGRSSPRLLLSNGL